jgi:hypothetical protein
MSIALLGIVHINTRLNLYWGKKEAGDLTISSKCRFQDRFGEQEVAGHHMNGGGAARPSVQQECVFQVADCVTIKSTR